MTTLATSKDTIAPNLFDKTGKNYIDCFMSHSTSGIIYGRDMI